MEKLDMRGQPCPIPVVKAKAALAASGAKAAEVLVDNAAAVQNLEKMALGNGFGFSFEEDGAFYKVSIVKGAEGAQAAEEPAAVPLEKPSSGRPAVLISADSMGRGDEELGRLLVKGFIFSLSQLSPPPEAVFFVNSGARLAAKGAATAEDLQELEKKGCSVYVCGACANFYKLADSLGAGSIVDMMFIVRRLQAASNVITI